MTGIQKNESTDTNDKKHSHHKLSATEIWKTSDALRLGNSLAQAIVHNQATKYLLIKQRKQKTTYEIDVAKHPSLS